MLLKELDTKKEKITIILFEVWGNPEDEYGYWVNDQRTYAENMEIEKYILDTDAFLKEWLKEELFRPYVDARDIVLDCQDEETIYFSYRRSEDDEKPIGVIYVKSEAWK